MRNDEQATNCAPLGYGLGCIRLATIYCTYLWRHGVLNLAFPPRESLAYYRRGRKDYTQ
jgi:hypothetical protein